MGQAKDRQKRREAKKAKRKLNHKAHVKASNVEKNSSSKVKGSKPPLWKEPLAGRSLLG